MDDTLDFKSLQDEVQAALVSTIKTAGQIASEDLGFHRSLNPEVGTTLDEQSARLLALSIDLLKSAASVADHLQAPNFEDAEDIDNNWRSVVDVVDSLLEKTDTCLDEYTGVIKRKGVVEESATPSKSQKRTLDHSLRTQNLVKPQLAFETKPDNEDTSPWLPLLTTKPHATVSLEESLGTFTNEYDQKQYQHPYETEILQLQYPDTIYHKAEPIPYLPVETTSATFVDTYEGVLEMLEELKGATEIAVDLEHHDTRSYVGLVSLMQISTRDKDWIVDTLKPWRQKLQVLNEVFADPSIIKVFHGAYMDIVWLQRDLGLYVVGLFDTHYACRSLGFAGGSLAFLLKKYINFDADKKYQLADWRIRPLPEEMFFYARADTHFLLFIYDNLRNELIDNTNTEIPEENRMEIVLQKSKETSLLRYERQIYNAESGKGPGGWFSLIYKTPSLLSSEQFAVLKAVHEWRDQIARKDDDSINFVMSNSVMLNLAKLMPMDMVALLSIVRPISHSVKSRSGELLDVIKTAKANGKDGPRSIDVLKPDTAGAIARASKVMTPRSKIDVTPVDSTELTTETSSFWGGAFGSSIWDQTPATPESDSMRLAIPLPQLSEEVFAPATTPLTDRSRLSIAESKPTPTSTPTKPVDEPFVIKRGSKRKSDVMQEDENPEYDISLNDSAEEAEKKAAKAEKKARRAEKKARKLEKSLEKEQKTTDDEDKAEEGEEAEAEEEEEEDFDYSKAESVLHGQKQKGGKGDKKGGRGKKPFDPYAKSMDTGKGMRRVQGERSGRSATFKN